MPGVKIQHLTICLIAALILYVLISIGNKTTPSAQKETVYIQQPCEESDSLAASQTCDCDNQPEKVCPSLPLNDDGSTNNGPDDDDDRPWCDDLFRDEILNNEGFDSRNKSHTRLNPKKWMTHLELTSALNKIHVNEGCYSPSHCKVRQRLAIIVPYRERSNEIDQFVVYMHQFLQKQHREYCITFAEQHDKGQFNRAKLLNAGFDWHLTEEHPYWKQKNVKPDCFIFHDIDLLPEDLRNLYGCFGYKAHHMADKIDTYKYETQYIPGHIISSGGVTAVSYSNYKAINGHPNRYWGFGYEDQDAAVRYVKYNADGDELLPKTRTRQNDYMNEYIVGTTEEGGGPGFSRADKYGYYHQFSHAHSFTNGKDGMRFVTGTMLERQKSMSIKTFRDKLQWLDGLNTLSYQTVGKYQHSTYLNVIFEIRPMIPKRFDMMVNGEELQSRNINPDHTSTCDFVTFNGVEYQEVIDPAKMKNTGIATDEEAAEVEDHKFQERKCLKENSDGYQCNGYTQDKVMTIPFPISTSLDADDYVAIRHCKDHIGIFQVLPEIKFTNSDSSSNLPDKSVVKFQYRGKFQQRCMKFSLLYRLFYEGQEIRTCYQMFDYSGSASNGTRAAVQIDNDNLVFTITDTIDGALQAGVYFNVITITDMSGQPYVSAHNFYRVKKNGSRTPPPNVHKNYQGTQNTCAAVGNIDWRREMLLEYADYFTSSLR